MMMMISLEPRDATRGLDFCTYGRHTMDQPFPRQTNEEQQKSIRMETFEHAKHTMRGAKQQ
jgi:hypothetical protein